VHLSTQAAPYAYALGGACLLLLIGLVAWWRSRRALRRRLAAVVLRLGESSVDTSGHRLEVVLGRLEGATEEARLASSEAEARSVRLAQALEAVGSAVVVRDDAGLVDLANLSAITLAQPGPGRSDGLHPWLAGDGPDEADQTVEDQTGPVPRRWQVRRIALDNGTRDLGTVTVVEDRSELAVSQHSLDRLVSGARLGLRRPMGTLALLGEMLEEGPAGPDLSDLCRRAGRELQAAAVALEQLAVGQAEGPIRSSPPR
jgi:PAS domain-containing protein